MSTDSLETISYILVVIAGLAVGSFLNVLVLRFDQLSSILKTRSRCPKCKKTIRWYDLVPFFSYIILGAKCRYCKKTISFQYPVVEVLTAIMFALIFWKFNLSWEALVLALTSSLLIAIATYDVLNYEVPDLLSYTALVFSAGFVVLSLYDHNVLVRESLLYVLYAVLIGGGFLAALVALSKEKWMGAGDIALGAILGLLLGFPNVLLGLFLAFTSGSVFGLILLAFRRKTLKDAVPFGPFIVLATFVGIFWGEKLVNWYLGTF